MYNNAKYKIGFFSNPNISIKGFHLIKFLQRHKEFELITCWNKTHEHTKQLMQTCDIIIMPTIICPEPLSRILIEGLSLGKPLLAFDIGGNSDAVIHNWNGYLMQNEKEILTGIKDCIINKEKYSKNSLQLYKEKFDNKKTIKKIISIYEELCLNK